MKKYIAPAIKIKTIDTENIMQSSLGSNPTSGLDNNTPINGGQSDGSHTVGAKGSIWDNDF